MPATYRRCLHDGAPPTSRSGPRSAVGAPAERHLGPHRDGRERPDPAGRRLGQRGRLASGRRPGRRRSACGSCHNPHGNGQYRILNNIRENDPVNQTWTVPFARRTQPTSLRFRLTRMRYPRSRRSRRSRPITSTPSCRTASRSGTRSPSLAAPTLQSTAPGSCRPWAPAPPARATRPPTTSPSPPPRRRGDRHHSERHGRHGHPDERRSSPGRGPSDCRRRPQLHRHAGEESHVLRDG